MIEGDAFLFRTSLGILKLFETRLLQSAFDGVLKLLNRLPQDMDEHEFFGAVFSIALTPKRFELLVDKQLAAE